MHFSHNSYSETEAKRSAILFLREHSKGLSNQADVELDMINAISAADIGSVSSRCSGNEPRRPDTRERRKSSLQQILHLSCQVHKLFNNYPAKSRGISCDT